MKRTKAYAALVERFAAEDRKEYLDALKAVLATAHGRVVLRRITELTALYAPSPLEHLEYYAGMRNAGLAFLSECNEVSPEMVLASMNERNEVLRGRNEKLKAAQEEKEDA